MSEHLEQPGDPNPPAAAVPPENPGVAEHTRRAFLFKLSLLLNAAVGAVLAVPLVGYLLGPARKKNEPSGAWVSVGNLNDFPVGETRLANFLSPVASFDDGETAKTACWVRRISDRQLQVFAINCAHLGCPVRWFAQSKLFLCPCHGGAYYEDGQRASGPPERGLFEYRYKLDGDSLIIHAGDMPTLATQASCKPKPLIQINPAGAQSASAPTRSDEWPA
ncbi:MAG TPA: ubiquinol-cytochrome c reductase iron-sulfur subunit [Acidobacteriaceae bacterium]